MKNDSIQQLLERYQKGTLDDSGLAELNRLTHRDEVMDTAERRAGVVIRRRRSLAFTIAGLLVAGGVLWTLLPMQRTETPMVAKATVPESVSTPEPMVEPDAPAPTVEMVATPAVKKEHVAPQPQAAPRPATIKQQPASEEPVVVCNNQCEADSVINDIWKFLTV